MIIHLKSSVSDTEIVKIAKALDAFHIKKPEHHVLVTPSALKDVPSEYESITEESFIFPSSFMVPIINKSGGLYLTNKLIIDSQFLHTRNTVKNIPANYVQVALNCVDLCEEIHISF